MKQAITAIIIFLILSTQAWGANIYVDDETHGATWDGTNGHSYTCAHVTGTGYTTIQAAINACSVGDTIYMRAGTYSIANRNNTGRYG